MRAERSGQGLTTTTTMVVGAAGDGGDGGGCCSSPRLLPVTTRELPYLNTMRYIVRVISYISPLNKHCLNI